MDHAKAEAPKVGPIARPTCHRNPHMLTRRNQGKITHYEHTRRRECLTDTGHSAPHGAHTRVGHEHEDAGEARVADVHHEDQRLGSMQQQTLHEMRCYYEMAFDIRAGAIGGIIGTILTAG